MGPTPSWGRGYGARLRGYARRRRGSGKHAVPVVAIMAAVASIVVVAAVTGATRLLTARDAAAAGAVNMNCTLIVPPNPLTAQGLATPYQLTATDPADGPCNEANTNQTAFVQGAVLNPATGQISVYDPLVIDQGSTPAVAPVVPQLPANGIVALWFGFNGGTLSLAGADQVPGYQVPTAGSPAAVAGSPAAVAASPAVSAGPLPMTAGSQFAPWIASVPATASASPSAAASLTQNPALMPSFPASGPAPVNPGDFAAASGTADPILQQANCIAGEDINGKFSSFTQVAACNAVAFFNAANADINTGKLRVPAPGTGVDGLTCLTTRNFALIDQDQSDNVTTQYLAAGNGETAQDTAANRQLLTDAGTLANGSDNGLLDLFVDPALGCSPWKVPDLADNGAKTTALPLDELQSAAYEGLPSSGPAALVPLNDPMTLDNNGNFSTDKTNAYRSIVDMPPLPTGETPSQYCQDMEQIQGTRLQQDVNLLINKKSPLPLMADNLFTFMAMRLQQSFVNLNCVNFGMTNDVSTLTNGAGVVVAACFLHQVAPVTPGAGNPLAGVQVCPVSGSPILQAGSGSPAAGGSPAPASSPAPARSGLPTPSSPADSVPVGGSVTSTSTGAGRHGLPDSYDAAEDPSGYIRFPVQKCYSVPAISEG
jgi:hypothetical protein